MVGIFKVKDLDERKRALAEQNDICRQMLQLEIRNLQVYGTRVQRKVTRFKMLKPLLALTVPLAGSLFFRRRSSAPPANRWLRLGKAAMSGYALYRKFGPMIRERFFSGRSAKNAGESRRR
jgi:hypothetical protein